MALVGLALSAYGSVALLLGAWVKRPIVWGLLLFIVWQRVALILPGKIDRLTIEKYISALAPQTEGLPSLRELLFELFEVQKVDMPMQPWLAVVTLIGITAAFVAAAGYAAAKREYSAAQYAGS